MPMTNQTGPRLAERRRQRREAMTKSHGLTDTARALLEAMKLDLTESGEAAAAAELDDAIEELDRIAKKYEMAIAIALL